jgi:hypothetical protein
MSETPVSTVTSAAEWKSGAAVPVDLPVPSGNICRARQPGMATFVRAGIVPNSLLPIVIKAMKTGKPAATQAEVEKDGEKVNDMIRMMDAVVCYSVVEPRVHPIPREEDPSSEKYNEYFERDDELLYVDEVDPEDKAFIFQWACGGTSDLEQFRGQFSERLANTPPSKDVRVPAKRATRARPKKS